MAKGLQIALAVLLSCCLCGLTYAKDPTCNSCLSSNKTLLVSCKNLNKNMTELSCENSVAGNCTLVKNCSETIAPSPTSTMGTSTSTHTNSSTAFPSSRAPRSSTTSVMPSVSPTPTAKPRPSTKHPQPQPHKPRRKFDAASFIGGILLCGGVILLVYIAVRCYKSKPDYSRL